MATPTTPTRLPRLALAGLLTNVAIVFTGGLVRVTGSGLGCPTWPTCDGETVVPRPGGEHATWQTGVEFGNRLMTFVVLAVAVAIVVEVRRHGDTLPATTRRLAWALPAGVLLQALVGGITVLLELDPLVVATHFLLSMVLVALATALHERARAAVHGPDDIGDDPELLRTGLRWTTSALTVVAAVVLILGTLVTAAGPHAGDPGTPRLGIDIRFAAIAHADAVWALTGITIALLAITWRHGPARLRTAVRALAVLIVLQGALGYTQYALGIPAALVAAHILGATLVWTLAVAAWARARPEVGVSPGRAEAPADR